MFTKDKNSDNFSTDKIGWELIKEYIPKNKIIWCPFYNDGKQKNFLNQLGFNNVIHQDKDFFSYVPKYDFILDNPPYSKFKIICNKLKELDKPFIIIAISTTLQTKWFQNLFKEKLQLIIPCKRTTFTHLTNPKKGYTPPFGTIYYCYKMNLKKDLIFL